MSLTIGGATLAGVIESRQLSSNAQPRTRVGVPYEGWARWSVVSRFPRDAAALRRHDIRASSLAGESIVIQDVNQWPTLPITP